MPKKVVFTSEDIKEIILLYQTTLPNTHKIAEKFNVGHKRITQLLKDNNIPIDPLRGRIKHNKTQEIENASVRKIEVTKEGFELFAVCKETGREFKDAMNKSGTLTNHLREINPEVEIPTNTYQRKKFELENGYKWYEEYFDIVERQVQEVRSCSLCDWTTVDVENKTGCFENHLNNTHNIPLNEYLEQFPDEKVLHSKHISHLERQSELSNPKKMVKCRVCGEVMKNITNTHLAKHDMTARDYKLKFLNAPLISKELSELFGETRREANLNTLFNHTSTGETEVKEFIEGLGVVANKNCKILSGGEIDMIIEDEKLGIEFDGLYWHTEKHGKTWKYHLNKTIQCNDAGYGLIHIFEDEWVTKNILVREKLKYILGKSKAIRIGARKCTIKEIPTKIKTFFLDTYHIQGSDKSEIYYGAYFKNTLVGVMTFKAKRGMTNGLEGEYELNRFATNYSYIVSGLASKLMKHFIKQHTPKSIISFADRRWTLKADDNMYTQLGFELVDILNPSYTYYNSSMDRYKRLHKFGFGKSSLKKKYPQLDFTKTEYELAQELGYDRIWDCGLFKYELIPH